MSTASEKHIGRRAFLGLMVAGLAALFLGEDVFRWIGGNRAGALGTQGFRINSIAEAPQFDEATWSLTVDGLFAKPLTLDFSHLTDLPHVDITRDFQCVEGWVVDQVVWRGVRLAELLDRAQLDPSATHLIFHSSDKGNYTDSLTIEEARRNDTLLSYRLNGEPLPHDMGSPLRLVYPGHYGYKYVKWVVRVEAVKLGSEGYKGYWEHYGYTVDATIP